MGSLNQIKEMWAFKIVSCLVPIYSYVLYCWDKSRVARRLLLVYNLKGKTISCICCLTTMHAAKKLFFGCLYYFL